MHRPVAVAAVASLGFVLLAGCSLGAAPVDGDPAVSYNVTNLDATPVSVDLLTAPAPVDTLSIEYANGSTRTIETPYDVTGPDAPRSAVLRPSNVTGMTAPGTTLRESFELAPGASATGDLADVAPDVTFVLVATRDGRVVAVGVAGCGPGTRPSLVDFVTGGYGPGVGLVCSGA